MTTAGKTPDMNAIGKKIRIFRRASNFTQLELAREVNVSSQVVSNWERGYTFPDHDDIIRLADVLGVTTDALLYGEVISVTEETSMDPDIRAIFRGASNMSSEDRQKLRKLAETLFPEAFSD